MTDSTVVVQPEDVLATELLARRPARPPQHEAENRSLVSLAMVMAERPETLFQKLAEAALELTEAESAGISLLKTEDGQPTFYWRATAGAYQPFLGTTLPRDFSPCGTVLDRNATQLMTDPARFWPYINDLKHQIAELLLVPFYQGQTPIGTVWVVSHTGSRPFDAEDARLIASLSRFASAAVQVQNNLVSAEAANQAKDRHLAFLAHELRGPLTPALLAATSMGANEQLPPEVRADALMIQRNIELTARLADDLLDANRIAHGKLELRVERIDAHETIRAAAAMCAADAAAQAVKIELHLAAARHIVAGDASKLTQVWCNLLKNAVKFSQEGGTVHVHTSESDDGRLRVEVQDEGEGIDPSLLPRIFNLYEQGERSVTRKHAGLGLGLAICKGIVEAHGGAIVAHSEGMGRGTTVTTQLALANSIAPMSTSAPKLKTCAGVKILLVDDHEDTLRVMARLLRELKHTVITATGVGPALLIAAQQEFDLLISDLGLDDGSGMDLMRRLLEQRPIKGIALTGYGTAADVEATLAAGFIAHMAKPVNLDQLQSMILEVTT